MKHVTFSSVQRFDKRKKGGMTTLFGIVRSALTGAEGMKPVFNVFLSMLC